MIASSCRKSQIPGENNVWVLKDIEMVAGFQPKVLGNPVIVNDFYGHSVSFNGVGDGLIMPVNPLENLKEFTVEVLFRPSLDGPAEQRFIHFQDHGNNRGLIETRVTPGGKWYLDTYLHNGADDSGLTLADSTLLHPLDEWYMVALVYDGTTMSHYVNGVKEAEGKTVFGPMGAGETSLGVRLNQVFWYKGLIREIRFHSLALRADELQLP